MSGDWKPGHRLPFEEELAEQYDCARMTVNRALSALVQSGLIERRRRAGTFVATPRFARAALEIPDTRSEVRAQGKAYRIEVPTRLVRVAGPRERGLLRVTQARVLELHCRHFADDRPYAVEERLINLDAAPEAERADFLETPPGSWLLKNVTWTEAEHRITAIGADVALARQLAVGEGSACLVLERWTWRSAEGITYARQIYPGDRYAMTARFDPTSAASAIAVAA